MAEAWFGSSAIGFGKSRQRSGCWVSARTSACGLRADRRYQRVEIGRGGAGGKIPVPQRHVEGGVLAAHEAGGANAVLVPERERQQQQRPALGVIGDDDEGPKALAFADLALPGG